MHCIHSVEAALETVHMEGGSGWCAMGAMSADGHDLHSLLHVFLYSRGCELRLLEVLGYALSAGV